MTGKEIAEICASHELCSECEFGTPKTHVCGDVIHDIHDMVYGVPSTILKILEKDYGGDS